MRLDSPIRLSIVIPTYNESQNIREIYQRITTVLENVAWEIVFVDDDSPDCTAETAREIAIKDSRVRCLKRIGRRGLSSACIEGMLSTAAPVIAVMDADLQHDESLLIKMLPVIERDAADIVVATRYALGGGIGNFSNARKNFSKIATWASRAVIDSQISDPMSGFFMMKRNVLDTSVHKLSGLGYKILLDILATLKSSKIRIAEIPYQFRERFAGESKLDEMAIWEYGMLIADKTIGRLIPVRFLSFSLIGGCGLIIHFLFLWVFLNGVGLNFTYAQSIATIVAMITNFYFNNVLTYRDQRLKGWFWFKGLFIFILTCSIGALSNVGIATYIFERNNQWMIAGLCGVLIGAVWNFALTQVYTWRIK
jgi:dolichol-phosphate mannosyltransferase